MAQHTSQSFSMNGWNFAGWFKGNWSTIKEALKVGIPWITAQTFFSTWPVWAQLLFVAAGKLVLDAGHYYLKD